MADKFYGILYGEKFTDKEQTAYAVSHSLISGGDLMGASVTPDTLTSFIKGKGFDGLIVSPEYGKTVMPLVSKTSPAARAVGALDVIVKGADGKLYGDNTAIPAFAYLLGRVMRGDGMPNKCIILGNGPDANAVKYVLSSIEGMKVDTVTVTEKGKNNFENIILHADAELLVNTASGMTSLPFSLDSLPLLSGVIDLGITPLNSPLMQAAKERGIPAINGVPMVAARVKAANELFFGVEADDDILAPVEAAVFSSLMTVTLISTDETLARAVAPALGAAVGKKSFDLADIFEKLYCKTISQIKALSGPGSGEFDRMLRVAVEWMKKRSGCIICVPSDVAEKPAYRKSIAAGGPIIGIVRPDEDGELLEGFCDILVQIDDASCADIAVEAIRAELQI